MATLNFTATLLVSHRAGDTRANSIRQGFYAPEESGSGESARNTGHWGFDFAAINTALSGGMLVDGASMTMTSTSWGVSDAYTLHIYKSPFAASSTNLTKLDPNDSYPAGDIYALYPDYFESPAFSRSQTQTFSIPIDLLDHIRSGKLLACYRRTTAYTPTSSIHTREFTAAPILTIEYHAPVSEFTLNKTTLDAGQTIIATVTPSDSSYTHRLTWKINSSYTQQTTIAAGSTTSAFTIPFGSGSPATNNWCTAIPNNTSVTCTCIVETLSGATVLGSRTKTFTMTVPISVKPTLASLAASLVNGYGGLYLQNRSKVTLTGNSPAGIYGSTIVSYSIGGGATNPFTTGVLSTVGTNTFYATVTDSRGRTSDPKSVVVTVTAYTSPKITSAIVERASDSDGTLADEGTYAKCIISYTWTNLGSNTNSTTISYRELGSTGSYTTASYNIASGGYETLGSGTTFDTTKLYEFKFEFADGTGVSDISGVILYKAEAYFDWHPSIDGACFGGFAAYANTFEIAPTRYLRAYGQVIGVPSNRNLLMGDFSIWQRGTSFTTTGYTADRWLAYSASGQTVAQAANTAPVRLPYSLRNYRTSTSGDCTIMQIIENYTDMAGYKYVLSFWAKGYGGYTGTYDAIVGTETLAFTLTANWARYELPLTSNFAYNATTGRGVCFTKSSLTSGQGIELAGCKLECGSIATPFIPRPYAEELALCQRYGLKIPSSTVGLCAVTGGSDVAYLSISTPVTMRVQPSINSGISWSARQGGYIYTPTSYSLDKLSPGSVRVALTFSPALATNSVCGIFISSDVFLDAEIY